MGFSNGGPTIPVWNTADTASLSTPPDVTGLSHGSDPQALSISPDGTRVAVADGGTIYVSSTSLKTPSSATQLSLPGNGSTTAIQFLGSDDRLLSATGSTLVLWNLSQIGRIGTTIQVRAPYVCEACGPPQTDISPNGKLAATLAGNPLAIYAHDLRAGGPQYSIRGGLTDSYQLLGWDSSSSKIFLIKDGYTFEAVQISGGVRVVEQRHIAFSQYGILAFSPADQKFIEISDSGSAQIMPLTDAGSAVSISSPIPAGDSLIRSAVDPSSSFMAEQFESAKSPPEVKIVDLNTGQARAVGSGAAADFVFSGGYLIIQRADDDVEIWNTAGTDMEHVIQEDPSYLPNGISVETSPAVVGTLLVQERTNGTLAVTELSTGKFLGARPYPVLRQA